MFVCLNSTLFSQVTASYNPSNRTISASYSCSNDPFFELEEIQCPGDPYDTCYEGVWPTEMDWYFFFHWSFPPSHPLNGSPAKTATYIGNQLPYCWDDQSHQWPQYIQGQNVNTLWNNYNVCMKVLAVGHYNDGSTHQHETTICHFN